MSHPSYSPQVGESVCSTQRENDTDSECSTPTASTQTSLFSLELHCCRGLDKTNPCVKTKKKNSFVISTFFSSTAVVYIAKEKPLPIIMGCDMGIQFC